MARKASQYGGWPGAAAGLTALTSRACATGGGRIGGGGCAPTRSVAKQPAWPLWLRNEAGTAGTARTGCGRSGRSPRSAASSAAASAPNSAATARLSASIIAHGSGVRPRSLSDR